MQGLKTKQEHLDIESSIADKKILTFGLNEINLTYLKDGFLSSKNVIANFDNNPSIWGGVSALKGVHTYAPSELPFFLASADFVLIMSGRLFDIGTQLDAMGLKYYWLRLFEASYTDQWHYGNSGVSYTENMSKTINLNKDKIAQARLLLLHDPVSIKVFDTVLYARTLPNVDDRIKPLAEICQFDSYCPEGIYSFTDEEVLVDGGAYIGDTVKWFIEKTNGHYRQIYAFEPDKTNYEALLNTGKRFKNIKCYPYGIADRTENVLFRAGSATNSRFSEDGNEKVQVCRLDDVVDGEVTFIKLDIEGYEKEAILGAASLIKNHKPKLAICVYHKITDYWELPLLVHELCPEYKIYMRHHDLSWGETVMYAKIN